MEIQRKPKVLIINSYAVNNGDAALVIALYNELKQRGYPVNIVSFHYKFLQRKYPKLPLIRDLSDNYILRKLPFLRRPFVYLNFLINRVYNNHDVYISSPGGYINSYYNLESSILPLILAKKKKKKTAIYSQSIGPFTGKDKIYFSKACNYIDCILTRDEYSWNYINSLTCQTKIIRSRDAAFLLPPRVGLSESQRGTVAVSVREWTHDQRSMHNYINLMRSLCNLILSKGYNIEFISTCQGVKNYRDDSITASTIKQALIAEEESYDHRVEVNGSYFTVYELSEYINQRFVFTVGTRLHFCILSIINGVPAFNISYEIKGLECYRYLDIEKYSADFNESIEIASEKLTLFMTNLEAIRNHIAKKVMLIHEESKSHFDLFLSSMNI